MIPSLRYEFYSFLINNDPTEIIFISLFFRIVCKENMISPYYEHQITNMEKNNNLGNQCLNNKLITNDRPLCEKKTIF